jgi:hypothetical protein
MGPPLASCTWAMPSTPTSYAGHSTTRRTRVAHCPRASVQAPELLEAATLPLPAPDADCAQAQVAGDQEPFVNRAIAALGLAVITRLCQRRLTWRPSFFDLEVGTLHYTHVDQHDVARLVGIRAHSLLRRSSRLAVLSA